MLEAYYLLALGRKRFYGKPPSQLAGEIMQVLFFTKMLKNKGNLALEEAADYVSEIGFDGADLTVREAGYVLPEEATAKLDQAIKVFKSKGLSVPMITTNVTDAEAGYAKDIFKAASKAGVTYIKLGYWRYAGFGKIRNQIEETTRKIDGICSLSKKYGVNAAIHIHAGAYLSADPALLYMLLKDRDPEMLGAYIDPGHMYAEAGPQGWEMALDLLATHIRLVAVKNYRWLKTVDNRTGEKKWQVQMMPLREEIVPWPRVFTRLREIGFDGCISVHSEYDNLNFEDLIKQTKEDLRYLRDVLADTA